jgi:hypothetical protein
MTIRLPHYWVGLLTIAMGVMAMSATARQIMVWPSAPGAAHGFDDWNHGTSGGGYQSVDNTDPATGVDDFTLGNTNVGRENHADWRSQVFALGPAAGGVKPVTFSFSYKLQDTVNDGDNMRVQLRFYSKATNFISQKEFWLGSSSHDSEMTSYKKMVVGDFRVPKKAQAADVTISANYYDNDRWTSGTGRFADFSVTTASRFPLLKVIIGSVMLSIIAALSVFFIHNRSQKV